MKAILVNDGYGDYYQFVGDAANIGKVSPEKPSVHSAEGPSPHQPTTEQILREAAPDLFDALEDLLLACPTSCEDRALINAQIKAEWALKKADPMRATLAAREPKEGE